MVEMTSHSTYLSCCEIWGAKHIQYFLAYKGHFPLKLFRALAELTVCLFDRQVVFSMRDANSTWYVGTMH